MLKAVARFPGAAMAGLVSLEHEAQSLYTSLIPHLSD
jgi:hypothetical protein